MEKGSGPESWNNILGWRTSLTVSVKKKKIRGMEKKNQEDKENKTKIKTKQYKTKRV